MMGIRVMPTEHPMYWHEVGNNGKPCANRAMNESGSADYGRGTRGGPNAGEPA